MPLLLRSSLLALALALVGATSASATPVLTSYESPNSETITVHGSALNGAKQLTILTSAGTLRIYQPSGSRGANNPAGDSFVWSNNELTVTGDPRLPGVLIKSVNVDSVALNQVDYFHPARIDAVDSPADGELRITGLHFTGIPDLHVIDDRGVYHSYANPRTAHKGNATGRILAWTDTEVRVQDPAMTGRTLVSLSFSDSRYPTDPTIGVPRTTPIVVAGTVPGGGGQPQSFVSAYPTCPVGLSASDALLTMRESDARGFQSGELMRVNLATGAVCQLQRFAAGFDGAAGYLTGNGQLLTTPDRQRVAVSLVQTSDTDQRSVEIVSTSAPTSSFEPAFIGYLYSAALPVASGSIFYGKRNTPHDYTNPLQVETYQQGAGVVTSEPSGGSNSTHGAILSNDKIVYGQDPASGFGTEVIHVLDKFHVQAPQTYSMPQFDGSIVGFAAPADASSPLVYFATLGGNSFGNIVRPGPGVYSFNVLTGDIVNLGALPVGQSATAFARVGSEFVLVAQINDQNTAYTMPVAGGSFTARTQPVDTTYGYDAIAATPDGHIAFSCLADANSYPGGDLCIYDTTQPGVWPLTRITLGAANSVIYQIG